MAWKEVENRHERCIVQILDGYHGFRPLPVFQDSIIVLGESPLLCGRSKLGPAPRRAEEQGGFSWRVRQEELSKKLETPLI